MSKAGSVLIIEDDADVLRAARVALMPEVEHIECAATTLDLEARLAATEFDVVLLDMNFVAGERSGREGLDALALILNHDAALSVVLMTAYGGVSLAVDALKHGAADFVLKPWRNEKLVAAVLAAISRTHARRTSTLDLETLERDAIAKALARCDGNISLAAAFLGLSRAALYRRISKHGL